MTLPQVTAPLLEPFWSAMLRVPGEFYRPFQTLTRLFMRKNARLNSESARCMVYLIDSLPYVDTSTSKASFQAAPAGIAEPALSAEVTPDQTERIISLESCLLHCMNKLTESQFE